MKYSRIVFLFFFFLFSHNVALGQTISGLKPRWMVSNIPQSSNDTYVFVKKTAVGASLDAARESILSQLASDELVKNSVKVSRESSNSTTIKQSIDNGQLNETINKEYNIKVSINGEEIDLKALLVDEYYQIKDGFHLTSLYQVALYPNSVFDNCILTTNYASDPATWGLSLIPGAAQMHKGDYLKGGIIMGGTVALGAGALIAENLRNVNKGRIAQTHSADVKKQYNDRVNTCATVRNVCLGGLAAAYIYNIIDAFVAPGARRIIVTPSSEGVGLTYNF